jgi:tRNA-2-methylthio-N6-dimethylallyladenosine synthase
VLCEGPSKTNPSRLMGRTRTNKIVLFESVEDRTGTFVEVQIERATGFSLYGARVATHAPAAIIAA